MQSYPLHRLSDAKKAKTPYPAGSLYFPIIKSGNFCFIKYAYEFSEQGSGEIANWKISLTATLGQHIPLLVQRNAAIMAIGEWSNKKE